MIRPLNPFLVEGYIDKTYFCDREEETSKLIKALESGRNVTLISPRRMGKSGLIHHAFSIMRAKDKEIRCFYIDLLHTTSVSELIDELANAVFGQLEGNITKLYNRITTIFRHCRPVISADPYSGTPTVTLNIDPGQEKHTIKEIFDYLKGSAYRIYIALDEFQQISEYNDEGIEALLRSYIQFAPNIRFIFAGSKKHMMHAMFMLPSRPFYQSTQTMSLLPIPKEKYYEFCRGFFEKAGKELLEEAFSYVYESVKGHTWYIQYWMSKQYDDAPPVIDTTTVRNTLEGILREEEDNFYTYMQLLTTAQKNVVRGIAKARVIESPLSSEELTLYGMGAPSTVRSAIKTLTDKEILLEDRDTYSIYNRFFMLWLSR